MNESYSLPYCFLAIPHEMLTNAFLKDPIMIRFVVWMMHRVRPFPNQIPIKNRRMQLKLDPFEFMFGRMKCAEEAGISQKNARTRLEQLIGLGYVEEVAHKRDSNYTVYRLVKTAFKQNSGQHNGQETDSQKDQSFGHKRKTEVIEDKFIIGSVIDNKEVSSSLLSDKQKEDISIFIMYCESKNLAINKPSLSRWILKYDVEFISSTLSLLENKKDSIKKHEAWMETALRENYVQKNKNIKDNREFIKFFVEQNQWKGLKITKAYCTHQPTGKDYQFNLPIEHFKKMIIECFQQYRN